MAPTERLDAYHFYEQDWDSYEELQEAFEWEVPDRFNIAAYTCDRWANERGRVAVFAEDAAGNEQVYTFWRLQQEANRLANYLSEAGVERGDRVGVNLNQRPETLVAHIACWKLGAVSVPLSLLFGPEAIEHRLGDCDAVACIVEEANVDALREADLPALETVLTLGDVDRQPGEMDLHEAMAESSREFETLDTHAEDDAIIIYTSGTTGPPKGVRHVHRFLLGHLPVTAAGFIGTGTTEDRVTWTPVEWSWIGSLFSAVMPTLYYGQPVVAYAGGQFDPHEAFRILEKYGVTSFSAPPTALRMMMQVEDPDYDFGELRTIGSGGESVGEGIRTWAAETFGVDAVEEAYGQTEANLLVSERSELVEHKGGKMGPAAPGHEVAIVDERTRERLGPGEVGEIAVRYEDNPVCFTEYWERPEKTARKVQDGWLLTEDLGTVDEDGYFEFVGRTDDVIISSGYKIGPEEVEETLAGHDAVADVGVIGVPDDERGQVPKAFIVTAGEHDPADLRERLQEYVRDRLANYEYPREIEFLDDLPRTSTEKVRRRDLRKREGLVEE
jgi:acetyl-CoA synthetase